jgi:hypothetical protein
MRGLDFIATAAAVGIFGYFIYKVILPKLGDLQLPVWQPPAPQEQPVQYQQPAPDQVPPAQPIEQDPEKPKSDTKKPKEDVDPPATKSTNTIPPQEPSTPPTPPVTGGQVIWSSKVWANGKTRTLASHGATDPDDPRVELRAGDCKNTRIDGKGTAFMSCNQGRLYINVPNYNVQMQLQYIHNSTLDNLSLRLRSHRDKPGGFGGYKFVINRDTVEAAWQDAYGGKNPKLGNAQLPQPMPANQWVTARWHIRDVGARIEIAGWINYGSGFVKVLTAYEDAPPPVARDKAEFLKDSTTWIRVNGPAKDVPIRNVTLTSLG